MCLCLIGCDSLWVCRIRLQDDEVLNQEVALRVSKDVIRSAGYDPNDFEPFPIREEWPPETRSFGTGSHQPPHGYPCGRAAIRSPGNVGSRYR
jgi:hypothetical protein